MFRIFLIILCMVLVSCFSEDKKAEDKAAQMLNSFKDASN